MCSQGGTKPKVERSASHTCRPCRTILQTPLASDSPMEINSLRNSHRTHVVCTHAFKCRLQLSKPAMTTLTFKKNGWQASAQSSAMTAPAKRYD